MRVSRNVELCFTLCQSLYLRQRRMNFQVSSRGTRNRSTEMPANLCHQYLHLQASQETHSTGFWQLTPFSFMFCGRQSSLLLWHYLSQSIVETVTVLRQSVLHIYRVKMSGVRLSLVQNVYLPIIYACT